LRARGRVLYTIENGDYNGEYFLPSYCNSEYFVLKY